MEDLTVPFSTAPSDTLISQEVPHSEDYDLAAVLSQFSEFRDNSESDIDEEGLKDINLDDSLFVSDRDEDLGDSILSIQLALGQ